VRIVPQITYRQQGPATTIAMESGGELSVDQLVTLLKDEVWSLSAFGTKYKSTVSSFPPTISVWAF